MTLKDTAPRALPVVLGGGLTGLAISRQLSRSGIRHMLLCSAPGNQPRLGESLNAEGSLELRRQFPSYERFFHDKRRLALFFGEETVSFDALGTPASPAWLQRLDWPGDVQLLHLDRIGFDQALYDEVVAQPACIRLDERVVGVEAGAAGERVRGVRLASGRFIAASYLFDATNHLQVLPRALGIQPQVIGEPRRVVFAHYRPSQNEDRLAPPPWMRATSLLRLERARDAADGLAWCIPLGGYVSVGVGVDPARTGANAELLLQWVERALASRGIGVREAFGQRTAPVDLHYRHYDHPRCYGPNWLLAGPTCCQVWFPSAAGVGSGLLAARLAVDLLHAPMRAGALIQQYMHELSRAHARLDWLAHGDPAALSGKDVERNARAMARGNIKRLAGYVALQPAPRELSFGTSLLKLFEDTRRQASPVTARTVVREAQAGRMFAADAAPQDLG